MKLTIKKMSLRVKTSNSRTRLSSLALQKHLNALKNLSKTPPRIWRETQHSEPNDRGELVLSLTHPLLRALDSCNGLREFDQLNSQLIVSGIFQHPLTASRVVKKLCSDSRTLSRALYFFDRIEEPDAFLCNVIMRSFVNLNDPITALRFYYQCVVERFVAPNHFTFPILVKACAGIGDVKEGKKAHSRALKSGFVSDLFVRNSLIHLYSACGSVVDAREVFDEMPELDLVSWNSMLYGYVKNGELRVARKLFEVMPERDVFSWNTLVSGYVEIGFMEAAKMLFDIMPEKDIVSWNCMIDGYARTVNITEAVDMFNKMPSRNIVSWNTILALFVRIKDYNECLVLFDRMLEVWEGKPNEATLVSVLAACASFGRLERGKWVHAYIESNGIKPDMLLSTALLTMYAKCGDMDMARKIFNDMPDRSVVSWNSLIMGYGMHGNGEKALEIFFEMEKRGYEPNDATFVCILSACAHSGMVLEGWWCFDLMRRTYKIEPRVEHYGCMVDILSRAGLVKDSEELIKKMPMEAGPAIWGSLLSACRTNSNSELDEIVAKRLIELEQKDIGPYIMLSNIYASKGRWDDVEKVRKMIKENGLHKQEGKSAVRLGDSGPQFPIARSSPHRRSMVYLMLNEIGCKMKLHN